MCDSSRTTRRQAFGVAGGTGVALLFAGGLTGVSKLGGTELAEAASATCALTPNKTIGPYFKEEKLNRSDVRESQLGTDLALTLYLFDADNDCAPVSGAQVDIWHANYQGHYSDFSQEGTSGQTWLRGYQVTDADGKVTFTTKYPGWYSGRAVHIHFRVRTSSSDFTSQMFFTDQMNSTVFATGAYASRGNPSTTDSQDNILGSDADTLTLHPTASGGGYAADFSVGLSGAGSSTTVPSATPTATATTIAQSTATPTATSTGSSGSTTADEVCEASLKSARGVRTGAGARFVRVIVTNDEAVTVAARVTRSGHKLIGKQVSLAAGTHVLKLAIGSGVKAGAARVTLRVADGAGNSKKFHRSVHVPKRKA